MLKLFFLFFVLCNLICACVGQIVQTGQCDPNVPVLQGFNLTNFAGTWYEVKRTDSPEQNADCSYFEITPNGVAINVLHYGVNNNFEEDYVGTGVTTSITDPRLTLDIPIFDEPIDFWILLSNIDDFALAYSCKDISANERSIHLWVLGRESSFTNDLIFPHININIFNWFGITLDDLEDVDHSDVACYVLPIIEPGEDVVLYGQCNDTIPVQQDFNVTAFTGTWHQISSYSSNNSFGECNRAEYTLEGGVVNILNSEVINQTLYTISGTATLIGEDGSGRLNVSLYVGPDLTPTSSELWVISTDYTNYAISYTCQNLDNDQKRIFSWILSRTRELNSTIQDQIKEVITPIIELNEAYYVPTDRSPEACFYFPEPSDRPVVFRGQCDMNIPAVPNFDAERYMGLWHNIQLYPMIFQDGTCSNANYDLSGGIVNVFNTQVKNETLDTIRGIAVIATDDGTAKLQVSFPIAGTNLTTTTDYWVLATNYTSYALVYSCTNLEDDNMQVTSWKLSRSRTLSAEDNEAIDRAMNVSQVLDQQYFRVENQTDEACYFVPTPDLGQPVVFPGQCDQNIYMSSFNLAQFQGTWYEIQAYPKEEQQGQCISYTYSVASPTQLDMTTSSVYDQFRNIVNGTLTSTGDGTGRLTINIQSETGTPLTIPFWIVNTNYTDYAVAYACVNRGEYYKAVWSWKLSRTPQLSIEAETAISEAIADIDILDNIFYEPIQHTPQACFYLPDFAPGEPIILNGQCDTSITGVSNFNLTRFARRWKLIQSYPAGFQSGTCNEDIYTQIDVNTISVTHTQVIDQYLVSNSTTASIANSNGNGTLQFTIPGSTELFDYIILDTDYENYALAYGCENIGNTHRQVWSWKLSTGNALTNEENEKINEIINDIDVLNNRYYYNVARTETDCFYFPEVNENSSSVIFRARCNESIPVVQNFRPEEYIGLWYDTQSYPLVFQEGTCVNANYSLAGAAEVDVFNTQVINQQLLSIWGKAVLASNDGSAKLNVSFEVGGIHDLSDYWVLATNYTSYAFVYSCREIDDEYIQVSSWKLSRSKTLSNEDNDAINEVISTIPVLDNRFYRNIDQSEVGCFYFPEPDPNVPVVFPGQCNNTINTVSNFNFTGFQGTWHEIQAYPKDFQPGQCVSHRYSLISEPSPRFDLVSSSVLNEGLTQTNSVVTGTDGKLNIAINTPSGTQNIPFWIIDTDYSDYALAYSCVDQNNGFRSVYSWKLSRTRELSADADIAIKDAMANIDVIDDIYFNEVNQTDEACFYFPEVAPGEPVVFPGRCDTTIRGIANFSLSNFTDRWRLVEGYPSDGQRGHCIESRYNLIDSLTISATYSQVIGQNLISITGTAVHNSSDGSGILQYTFPGSSDTIEYIILDTNYDTYAVVYSCENINNAERVERKVTSWKLSRARTLSNEDNIKINQAISGIQVLDARYYRDVEHTESSCFYFPEVNENSSSVIFRARCNESIPVVQNFRPGEYIGLWYDTQSYPLEFQEGTCVNANYSLAGAAEVDVFNTQVINQQLLSIWGKAVLVSLDGSAKLNVSFEVGGIHDLSDYWVLATNYTSYAFVYSCREIDDEFIQVSSWKLSRSKTLSNEDNDAINEVISTIPVLDNKYYRNIDQSEVGCFYFPEPDPDVPVVFPGQCNNTINTVPNFNFTGFEGIWHEVQAYPKDFQPGHCVNHQYTLINEPSPRYNLVSSNVLDQTLSLTNSVVTGTDGKLSIAITTPSGTMNIPFWIIDTDYTDYALAYSCVNQGDDFRSVYSWKLSRNRTLSPEGNSSISYAMQNIDVIDDKYFVDVEQTDEACFYLPDLGPNDPVTFRGQCDQNISVVNNFNASRYLGRWRLIETYYSDFQNGSCIEASYLEGEDSVLVVNSQVVNEELQTERGSAVLASTDGSGKLLVTFPSSPEPTEYWIIATDYEDYALVYSCADIGIDRRRVWSWKMSRTTSLTVEADEAINNATRSINVLNNRYYQSVNHTDVACFYYPAPDVNRPVTFPGQCDMTIAAFPGFEPDRYLGFWYDVESYPAPFQTGTCQNANYTLSYDDTIRVENTQVINQVKETWIGSAVIDSDDGSAKLNVTFNINGEDVTSKYWVLATDYDSYAFVYSCSNIGTDRRSVFSWKLSKTPTLTENATAAIEAAIGRVQVLDQQYYIDRNHTEEACFYYPDNNGGDVILPGQCPDDSDVLAVTSFNANAFAGTWHEVSRFPSDLQRGECASNQFTLSGSDTFTVTQNFIYNERQETNQIQVLLPNNTRGAFSIDIEGVPFDKIYILATNYNDFALAYSCRNLNNDQKQIYSWKLSKTRSDLSDAANEAIAEIVNDNRDLWDPYYRPTGIDYDSCFYYPVFETLPSSIELPGPCPNNIRGVANFNASGYFGRWYETERYPLRGQEGQCVRFEYSLGIIGGVGRMIIVNNEVVEETLLERIGLSDPLTEGGRGEFVVDFTIDGVSRTVHYYVLATDYTSYSLVYSCANLLNGNREVFSWKLSRTKDPVESPVVDNVIASTQGLIQDYFQQSSQTDEDCFYIPYTNVMQSPRFRGRCENITGVEGFDVEKYLGWWHEIERYPIDGTLHFAGECRSSEYTQDGEIYRVVDTKVRANEGTTANGIVTVFDNGMLRKFVGGTVQDIWILATDYENYALLYSCEEIDDEYRKVWSAKHSKTRTLTPEAQTAMAPYITENRVLYSHIYLKVNQEDQVCFHYPDKIDGEVILPGQCDTNIPVQENFDMSGFAGTWYHLERYHQTGDNVCAGTRFTIGENGGISVVEFEVNDGELQTVQGTATVDGGKIDLTFPVPGTEGNVTTTSIDILLTDYLNYALVYTCSNMGPYRRHVRAWKLSRQRSWPAASEAAVFEVIRQREELHTPYFEIVEQRTDCPEPSSALIVKSSIIMLLVCALLQQLL